MPAPTFSVGMGMRRCMLGAAKNGGTDRMPTARRSLLAAATLPVAATAIPEPRRSAAAQGTTPAFPDRAPPAGGRSPGLMPMGAVMII
jgi:hypothetical protein